MANSGPTTTTEATKATTMPQPPVPNAQLSPEPEVDSATSFGQRAFHSAGGSSPQTPPDRYGALTGQISHAPGQRGDALRQLQRGYGNQYVGRVIQAKLTVGQPGDAYEQEADRVADQIMRMPEDGAGAGVTVSEQIQPLQIQRMCTACEEEEEEHIHRKEAGGTAPAVTPAVESRLDATRGGGQPLPESVRAQMEPRFGADFSGVRVHTGGEAAALNQNLNAQAFTRQRDIYFGAGNYAPNSIDGQRLLAHELTHVMQQRESFIQPTLQKQQTPSQSESGSRSSPLVGINPAVDYLKQIGAQVSAPDSPIEREATAVQDQRKIINDYFDRSSAQSSQALAPPDYQVPLGKGESLPKGIRHGNNEGVDFSSIRVHRGPEAAEAAQSLGARAFTVGRQIAFGKNEYKPHSLSGQQLLDHELAHAAQQAQAGGGTSTPQVNRFIVPLVIVPEDEPRPIPPSPENDPCQVNVAELTNVELLQSIQRTLERTSYREDYYYFDYMNLLHRLLQEKVRRINEGHRWMSERGITEPPSRLVQLSSADGLLTTVTPVDPATVRGLPQTTQGVILSEQQFQNLLAERSIPSVDVKDLYATGEANAEFPLQMHIPAPEQETSPAMPYFSSGFQASPLVTPALLGSSLTSPIEQMAIRSTLGRRWQEPQMRGFLLEDFLHYGSWQGRLNYTDLNRIRPSGRYVMDPFHGGTNFPVFDAAGRWGVDEIVSVAYSGRRDAEGKLEGSYYREKFRRMTGDFSEAETAKLSRARGRLSRLTGEPFTLSPTAGAGRIDLLSRTVLGVPEDHVDAVRDIIRADIRTNPQNYEQFFNHVLRQDPAQAGAWNLVKLETIQRARARTSGPGPRLTQAQYDEIVDRVAAVAAARVQSAGATEAELAALSSIRSQTSGLDRHQFGIVAAEQELAARVLMARGYSPDVARHSVAMGSARTGMAIAAGVTGALELGQLALTGETDPRRWTHAGADVAINAGGSFLEEYASARLSMMVSERALGAASTPGLTTAASRGITLSAAGGQTIARMGPAVVLAPLISQASISVEEGLGLAQYHEFEESARVRRDTATAVVGAGGALGTVAFFTLAGSEVPIVGNAVGFIVGLAAATLFDVTIGEDIEQSTLESLGANGCVNGQVREPPPPSPLNPFEFSRTIEA